MTANTCFFCGNFLDRGGEIHSDHQLKLVVDQSPVSSHHFLVIPNDHCTSFAALVPSQVHKLSCYIDVVHKHFKNIAVFENGVFHNEGVCGTTHAHTHLTKIEKAVSSFDILKRYTSSIQGEFLVDYWWPSSNYSDKWRGYLFMFVPNTDLVFTIYYKEDQHRQIARRIVGQLNGYRNYRYDIERDVRVNLSDRTQSYKDVLKFSAPEHLAKIITLEGLSGTGKTSLAKILAKNGKSIAIHSGSIFCSVANYLRQNSLPRSIDSVAQALKRIDSIQLNENELQPEIRLWASELASDQDIWLQIMTMVRDRAVDAARFHDRVVVEGYFLRRLDWGTSVSIVLVCDEQIRELRLTKRSSENYGLNSDEGQRRGLDLKRVTNFDISNNFEINTSRKTTEEAGHEIENYLQSAVGY